MTNPYSLPDQAETHARDQEALDRDRKPALSDDERAELERLRQDKAARDQADAEAAEKAKADEPDPTHWLHLADGRVIESAGQMTHYKGIPVIGSYPIVEEEKS